ncbi:hypothetical protein GCM10007937_60640 [Mesorhizobium albiziae]|nr:hypothetical protein GCM10007937_60640 [Mesorhizobium albiziae]
MGLGFLGLAAMKHGDQRLALLLVCVLVDDGLHRSVAFKDRTGPRIGKGIAKTIELNFAEMAAFDPANFEAPAVPLGRA